ncbi:serine/threonine-protein kinase [Streptomyces sp. NPDC051940]|uniref:serine/threonine-protein kinase n=1 Tax=Streptomyces sp. NPDC051940 TaxID=3155675 RepID=UPI00343E0EE0
MEGNTEAGGERLLAGRYRITGQLGRGGMGTVWRAVDEVLGREVAVKELRAYSDAQGPELDALRVRMRREARAAARVRHPGVVAVHDVVHHEGRPVIVMELVDGPSLADVLRREGTLDPAPAAGIGAQVLRALAAAHAAGVLHRDVKPGNILLERGGRVVLTDFGIATMDDPGDDAGTRLTSSGELVGSLDYLSPERARGGAPDAPADIWALGAALYAAVEGTAPFRRTSTWSTITAIVAEPLPEPRRAGPLGPVLSELMAKDPAARPDATRAAELLEAIAGSPAGADTARLRPQAPPQPQPHAQTELDLNAPAPLGAFGPPTMGDGPASGFPTTHAAPPVDSAAGHGPPKHRRTLVIAAVAAAVVLTGGGTALLLGGGDGKSGDPVAASSTPTPSAAEQPTGAEATATKGSDKGKESNRPSASPKPSKTAPGAGTSGDGTTGGSDGGSDGGTTGGSTGGSDSGGSDGGTTTASGGTTTSGSDSGGGGSTPEPSCWSIGGGKYNCELWRTADSYDSAHTRVGTLYQGVNYFYCQVRLSHRVTYGDWTNVWWAKTDDDSGNAGVFVSDVWIKGGDNDAPVPGLPVC